MAVNILPYQTLYSPFLMDAYQNEKVLGGVIMEQNTSGSDTFIQYITDKVEANYSPFQGAPDIAPTPVSTSSAQNSPLNIVLRQTVGDAENTGYNYNIFSSLSRSHGEAFGRVEDKLLVDKLFPSGSPIAAPTPRANVVPYKTGLTTGVNVTKISSAVAYLNAFGVSGKMRTLITNTDLFTGLMNDSQYISVWLTGKTPQTTNPGPDNTMPIDGAAIRLLGSESISQIPAVLTTVTLKDGVTTLPAIHTYAVIVHYEAATYTYNRPVTSVVAREDWVFRTNISTQLVANSLVTKPVGLVYLDCYYDPATLLPFNVADLQ